MKKAPQQVPDQQLVAEGVDRLGHDAGRQSGDLTDDACFQHAADHAAARQQRGRVLDTLYQRSALTGFGGRRTG